MSTKMCVNSLYFLSLCRKKAPIPLLICYYTSKLNIKYCHRTFQISSHHCSESIKNKIVTDEGRNFVCSGDRQRGVVLDSCLQKYEEIISSEQIRKKIHLMLLEYEVFKEKSNDATPSELSIKDVEELLKISTKRGRNFYFTLLANREVRVLESKKMKEERQLNSIVTRKEYTEDPHINYALFKNSIFLRINKAKMEDFYNYRLLNAKYHGQKLVLDLGFEMFMNRKECINFAYEMKDLYYFNRKDKVPFSIHLCNCKPDSMILEYFHKQFPLLTMKPIITVSEKNYLDLFPEDRIIYISQAARQKMEHFDPSAVYVIGPRFNDSLKLTFGKTKREKLKLVQFPYDDYVMWNQGTKSLKTNVVTRILLELKKTQDWIKAFQHIPPHKIRVNEIGTTVGLGKISVTRTFLRNLNKD